MIRSLALVSYRAALRFLLPERFRCEHGREMEVLFDEALQSAGRRGRLPWLFAVVRGLWDVAEAGLLMRSGSYSPRSGSTA